MELCEVIVSLWRKLRGKAVVLELQMVLEHLQPEVVVVLLLPLYLSRAPSPHTRSSLVLLEKNKKSWKQPSRENIMIRAVMSSWRFEQVLKFFRRATKV